MKWSEFRKSVDEGRIAPVYLFTGPEEHIKQESLEYLRKKLLPAGLEVLNDTTLEDVSARDITDAAETLPMMCDRRIVAVMDWPPLKGAGGAKKGEGGEEKKAYDGELQHLDQWLDDPPQTCALIFYVRGSANKKGKGYGILSKKATIVEFEELTDAEMVRWCQRQVKRQGKKISGNVVNRLTFMVGRDTVRILNELEKLCAYAQEDEEITLRHLEAIVSPSLEYGVFELMNHLLNRDMLMAQRTVKGLMQRGEDAMRLLAILNIQLRQMAHMKCALDEGLSVQSVQNALKMHPYAARQTARQCTGLSARQLTAFYEAGVEADFLVKSGRLRDRDALNRMLFMIGQRA